jgi:peptide chain release factor subunit 1
MYQINSVKVETWEILNKIKGICPAQSLHYTILEDSLEFGKTKIMRKSGILQNLIGTEATNKPFISVYLNAEPNEHGRDDFEVFLKKQLSLNEERFAAGSPERESFEEDVRKINKYAKSIPASANGVAIFACNSEGYFKTFEFDVPFENNRFEILNKPHIYPLARMVDQNPQFAVVLADSNEAKIYLMQRGEILNSEELESEKYSRSDAGGWSQMRFERHIDEMRKQHAKEIVDELEKLVRVEDVRQIVLAGNKDVVIPLIEEQMNDFLKERTVGTVRLEIETPEHEIIDQASRVIKRNDTVEDRKKIEEIKEKDYSEGKAVTGVAATFEALANGQIQELFVTAKFDEIEYDNNEVKRILKTYAPGEEGDLPSVQNPRQIADDLISRTFESADKIHFIEDETLLKDVGGVAALLRFTLTAGQ